MLPLVQLQLEELSAAAQVELKGDLLQLWFDPAANKEHVRVIPRGKSNLEEATPFDCPAHTAFEQWPIPIYWNRENGWPMIRTIVGLKSLGIESQGSRIEAILDDLGEDEVSQWLQTLTKLFAQSTRRVASQTIGLLGTFVPIQYGAEDVGMKCLLSIQGWGSSGGAQIFYKTKKDEELEFSFRSCSR